MCQKINKHDKRGRYNRNVSKNRVVGQFAVIMNRVAGRKALRRPVSGATPKRLMPRHPLPMQTDPLPKTESRIGLWRTDCMCIVTRSHRRVAGSGGFAEGPAKWERRC